MIKTIENALISLRKSKPLILNLTNYVTMDFMANCLLSLGALPIMSVCDEEFEELLTIASAVNINIGTLDSEFIEKCLNLSELAKHLKKPIILDPVGAGATTIRTNSTRQLLPYASIVRGNASEIMALSGITQKTKGVETIHSTLEAKEAAIDLALKHKNTVIVSGEIDFITDGKRSVEIPYGSPLMSLITGMGCSLSAVVAAFKTVMDESFEASYTGVLYFALCGELAARKTQYPGEFRTEFINALFAADFSSLNIIFGEKS